MLVARNPQKNTYELTIQDHLWMEAHRDDNPFRFIRGILKRRFENYSSQFAMHKSLTKACLKIVVSNSSFFKESKTDQDLLTKLCSMEDSNTRQVVECFRDLWRGYTDHDVTLAQRGLGRDKERILNILKRMRRKNETQISIYDRKRKQITKERLLRNREELDNIGSIVQRIFANPINVARNKLYYQAYRQRRPFLSSSLDPPKDYLGFEHKIHAHDPQKLIYPLRFLGHISARMYNILESKWQKGMSREELLLSFEDPREDDNSYLKELRSRSLKLFEDLKINRISQVDELEEIYSKKCYTASALLAVTLIEGILWDFASHLNRKRIKIFRKVRGKYFPYVWDYKNEVYMNIINRKPVVDNKYILTSARKLLMKTRLGSIVPVYLYDYLIDEYYDERNSLAHGYFAEKNMQVEAIAVILCFDMCVQDIISYMDSHKRVVVNNC